MDINICGWSIYGFISEFLIDLLTALLVVCIGDPFVIHWVKNREPNEPSVGRIVVINVAIPFGWSQQSQENHYFAITRFAALSSLPIRIIVDD